MARDNLFLGSSLLTGGITYYLGVERIAQALHLLVVAFNERAVFVDNLFRYFTCFRPLFDWEEIDLAFDARFQFLAIVVFACLYLHLLNHEVIRICIPRIAGVPELTRLIAINAVLCLTDARAVVSGLPFVEVNSGLQVLPFLTCRGIGESLICVAYTLVVAR